MRRRSPASELSGLERAGNAVVYQCDKIRQGWRNSPRLGAAKIPAARRHEWRALPSSATRWSYKLLNVATSTAESHSSRKSVLYIAEAVMASSAAFALWFFFSSSSRLRNAASSRAPAAPVVCTGARWYDDFQIGGPWYDQPSSQGAFNTFVSMFGPGFDASKHVGFDEPTPRCLFLLQRDESAERGAGVEKAAAGLALQKLVMDKV
jgi:hypothetical protein